MYMKMKLYSLFLIIHSTLCLNRVYNIFSKIDYQWDECIQYENLLYLNASIFVDDDPMPQYRFYIKIEKSSLLTLPPNAFKNCSMMQGTILSDVNIHTISPGAFNGTDQLAEIDLSKNKLIQVEEGVFNKVQNLKYLDLSNNCIKNVSDQSFKGLQKLNYLYLQGNQISFLSNNLFDSQVKSLLKLNISSNRLKEINETFKGLIHLTHLSLNTNNISTIAPDSLKHLKFLLELDISNNSIRHIQDLGLEKLNNFSVQNNKISFLDRNLFNSQKKYIIILNISSNSLKEINTVFHGMSHLTQLYLQVNDISNLAPDAFQNLSSLQHLDLSHNSIRDLHEHIFTGCESLTGLYLQNNKITFLDSNLFGSQRHSLTILNISSNSLKEIGTAFSGLSRLTNLHLQKNQILSTATNSFQDLSYLEYLDISHNNLQQFQYGLLDHIDHLLYLNFSYNKFETFPFPFTSYLTYIKELVFDNNKIQYLNATEILHDFPLLEKIGVSGNFNWSCTKLVRFVKELRVNKIDVLKGNYFTGKNVRGIACYDNDDDYITGTQVENSKECNHEIDPKFNDQNIKDLINVIEEKCNHGNIFIAILITISTASLIVIAFLQFFFVIKLRRNMNKEHVELL